MSWSLAGLVTHARQISHIESVKARTNIVEVACVWIECDTFLDADICEVSLSCIVHLMRALEGKGIVCTLGEGIGVIVA